MKTKIASKLRQGSTVSFSVITVLTLLGFEFSSVEINYITIFVNALLLIWQYLRQIATQRTADFEDILKKVSEFRVENSDKINVVSADMHVLKKQMEDLTQVTKYARFAVTVANEMRGRVQILTESSHPQVSLILRSATEHAVPIIEGILASDFQLTRQIILMQLYSKLEVLRTTVKPSKLDIQLSDLSDFKMELFSEVAIVFSNFAVQVETIARKYQNGDRTEPFLFTCVAFTADVVNTTNRIHNKYKM